MIQSQRLLHSFRSAPPYHRLAPHSIAFHRTLSSLMLTPCQLRLRSFRTFIPVQQSQAAVQAGEADAAAGGGDGATTASGTEGEGADGASEIAAPGDDAGAGAPAVSPEAATSAAAPPLPTPLHSARTIPNPTDEAAAAAAVAAAAAAAAAPKLSSHYHVMQAAGKLFDLSSATTDTDHPLCEECKLCRIVSCAAGGRTLALARRVHHARRSPAEPHTHSHPHPHPPKKKKS